jgi:hypothetical protein
MSVRAPFAAVAVVMGTVFAVGCAQTSSPTSPSPPAVAASASSSVSSGTLSTQITRNVAPVLVQLDRVDHFLLDANHELALCLAPQSLGHPPGPCDQNSLNFYLKANGALDDLAPSMPPGPPSAPAVDALNAIIAQANITLGSLVNIPPGPPCFPEIMVQAQHTISVATRLLSNACTADQCSAGFAD